MKAPRIANEYSSKCGIGDYVIVKGKGLQKIHAVVFMLKNGVPTPHYNFVTDRDEGFHSEVEESEIEAKLVRENMEGYDED